MTLYDIIVRIYGHTMVEDPKCPSRWKGSGCYDIQAPGWALAECAVGAETAEEAKRLACQYDWSVDEFCEIDDVLVEHFILLRPAGSDEAGVEVISVGPVEWKEDDRL